jgi:hypothetical protein
MRLALQSSRAASNELEQGNQKLSLQFEPIFPFCESPVFSMT